MKPEKLIGKTLAELVQETNVFSKPVHVFILEDENDSTGKRLMDVFSLRQVVLAVPAAANAKVLIADDICRETYIRILAPKEIAEHE